MTRNTRKQNRAGFTLIEILIVVVIMGILAATVLPQFMSQSEAAKESAIVQDLQLLRSQIQLYRFQHDGDLPTFDKLETALTTQTGVDGQPPVTGKPVFGPYIVGQLPRNPMNGDNTVAAATGGLANWTFDGTSGWLYDDTTGEIGANFTETLDNGVTAKEL